YAFDVVAHEARMNHVQYRLLAFYDLFMPCIVTPLIAHPLPTRRSSDLAQGRVQRDQAFHIGQAYGPGRMDGFGNMSRVRRFGGRDRKSTRLNSSHVKNSYAVYCLNKKTQDARRNQVQHGLPAIDDQGMP